MSNLSAFTAASPLVLVGCGNMGRALVRGWLTAGLAPEGLVILDPKLDPQDVPEFAGARLALHADELAGVTARLMVLAVKPQVMNEVLQAVRPLAGAGTIAVSVAAGVTLGQLRRTLGAGARLVRAMPNTPAAVGAGVTGLVADEDITADDKMLADAVMRAAGKTVWLSDESMMDAVTATSGSGPAYVFHMVEALSAAAVAAGLPADAAESLARQTIIGAARLLAVDADVSAGELRTRVTSPGGTTAAALEVLMARGGAGDKTGDGGLTTLMTRAVAAATKRGQELAD